MCVVFAATENHDEVHGPSSHWKPCERPWSMLLLPVVGKDVTVAVVPTTPDSEMRMRDIEVLCPRKMFRQEANEESP